MKGEIDAAWAQAILSALAIIISTLLAIYIPARERKLARLRQEMDAGRRLLWAITAVVSQYAVLRPELERRRLKPIDVKVQAQRIATIGDDMRTVQIVDVPVSMVELLWRTQLLVAYFSSQWDALTDPAYEGRGALAEADQFAQMATETGREISAIRIGRHTVGNPNAEWKF